MTPTNAELRQFITQFFSDEELETLCFDYFPETLNEFGSGMGKNRKVIALVGHCERRDRLADLHAALQRERPEAWRQQFAALPIETPRRAVSTSPVPRDPRQIFLSHATADADFAHTLAADLWAEGWSVWIAPESIRPGEKWVEAIDRGLETSGVFVVVLTPAAVASRWVRTETSAAISMEHRDLIRFIPLDVVECQPPWLWTQYQYIPFRGSYEVGLDALLRWLDEQARLPGALPEGEGASSAAPRNPGSVAEGDVTAAAGGGMPSRPTTPRERYVKEEQWRQLQKLAHEIAAELGRQSGDDETRQVYRQFNRHFGLTTYKKLPRKRFAEGLAFFTAWRDEVIAATKSGLSTRATRRIHKKTGNELIRIPAGAFLYGQTSNEKGFELQERIVVLPEYWIGRYPVTNSQFARFIQATNYRTTAEQQGFGFVFKIFYPGGRPGSNSFRRHEKAFGVDWRHPNGQESSIDGKADHPVVQVSWHDATAFCDWAGLVLPSEEQWEKAARGTDGRIWPWGNEKPTDKHCDVFPGHTTPVGHFSPLGDGPYGCADMAGSVWEWTNSWHPQGELWRLRGYSWSFNDVFPFFEHRTRHRPDFMGNDIGFRVVELLSDPDS